MLRRGLPPGVVGLAALVLLLGLWSLRPGWCAASCASGHSTCCCRCCPAHRGRSRGGDRRHRPCRAGPVRSLALAAPTACRRRGRGGRASGRACARHSPRWPRSVFRGFAAGLGTRRGMATSRWRKRCRARRPCSALSLETHGTGQDLPATPILVRATGIPAGPVAGEWRDRPVPHARRRGTRLRRLGGGRRCRWTDPPRSVAGHGGRRRSDRAWPSRLSGLRRRPGRCMIDPDGTSHVGALVGAAWP